MFDHSAGLDRDHRRVGVADRQGGADAGDDVIMVVVAVQQQHVTQGAGAGGVTVVAACCVPELLMGTTVALVGHRVAQGRLGVWPPRSSRIMVMSAFGSWKPRALARSRPMPALTDSARPLVRRHSMVFSIDVNRPGSDGGSGYWFPTPIGEVCWAA